MTLRRQPSRLAAGEWLTQLSSWNGYRIADWRSKLSAEASSITGLGWKRPWHVSSARSTTRSGGGGPVQLPALHFDLGDHGQITSSLRASVFPPDRGSKCRF